MFKPFLHEKTVNKIGFFNSDKVQWKAAIREDVDPSQLPAYYGGSRKDPDGNPQWLTKVNFVQNAIMITSEESFHSNLQICMGGQVPKFYYLANSKPNLNSFERNISISNGLKEKLEYKVDQIGLILR